MKDDNHFSNSVNLNNKDKESEYKDKQKKSANNLIQIKLEDVENKWEEILANIKPVSHSLEAFLRPAKLISLNNRVLELDIPYKFHKTKLKELKNKKIFSNSFKKIMGRPINYKCTISGENKYKQKSTNEIEINGLVSQNNFKNTDKIVVTNIKYDYHQLVNNGNTEQSIINPNSSWGKLRRKVLERDNFTCQGYKCESKKNLSIHHIVPLSLGGKNTLSNLTTLCLLCHEKTHKNNFTNHEIKGDINKYGNDVKLSKKIILLSDAIENNKDIEMDYTDSNKQISHRKISPNNITYGDYNHRIYIYAYCFLRNKLRTFRISKMENIKVVI